MNSMLKAKKGFTLIEILTVVGIITLLSTIGGLAGLQMIRRAQATKIASDFRKIEAAWLEWRADTHLPYPSEETAGYDDFTAQCDDEPLVIDTNLMQNTTGVVSPGWRGPYLASEPRDPFGRRYTYDADPGSTYVSGDCNTFPHGINIFLSFCPIDIANYRQIATIIDESIDQGDGRCSGKFRWNIDESPGNSPGLLYLLEAIAPT